MNDLIDRNDPTPPIIIVNVEADDCVPMKTLDFTFNVHGAVEDTSFVLRVNAPPSANQGKVEGNNTSNITL